MTTSKKLMGSLGLAVGLFTSSAALAVPISGEIQFFGSAELKDGAAAGNSTTADNIHFFNPVDVAELASSGSYGGFNNTATATFTDFTFGDIGATGAVAVSPLWQVVFGAFTYSFNLSSITLNQLVGSQRNIEGNGTATITGVGSPYESTQGHWTLSTSGNGTTITFSSATTAVPEGGSSLALLGVGLLTVGLVRRKLKA